MNIDDIAYNGYALHFGNFILGNRLQSKLKNCFATDSLTYNRLHGGIGLSDCRPSPGAQIYVAPGCPIATDDIRRNYNIRIKPDTGDYNILHPVDSVWQLLCPILAVFPKQKVMFRDDTEHNIFERAQRVFPNIQKDDMLCFHCRYLYFVSDPSGIYQNFIDGSLKKPCISYDNLNLDTDNKLNADILCIACNLSRGPSTLTDFLMQLNTINQCSWRKFPGTMAAFRKILYRSYASIMIRKSPSKYSKTVKSVMLDEYNADFADADDYNLCLKFLTQLMDMKPTMFVSYDKLVNKLMQYNVSTELFCSVFSPIVKITPKRQYDDAQNQVC